MQNTIVKPATIMAMAFFIMGGCQKSSVNTTEAPSIKSGEDYTGRIRLTRFLDEPDGYCIDVPGPVFDVQLQLPAIAHTCHFGPVEDQVFTYNADGTGQIRWQYKDYDVCLTAKDSGAASGFKFSGCDQPDKQAFDYTSMGKFKLRGTDLCLAVEKTGPGYGEALGAGQDPRGRGHSVNAQYTHLKRDLVLADCNKGDRSMSAWQAYIE